MKNIIYISILIFFVSSSFIKEKSLQKVLIGNCWVSSSFKDDTYTKSFNFHPNKHGLRFVNEEEIILFTHDHWCASGRRKQMEGVYDFLNDSTIEVRYKYHNESIISLHYKVLKKTNRQIEIELLSFQERFIGDYPKPFLD